MIGLGAGCAVFIAQFWGRGIPGTAGVSLASGFLQQLFFYCFYRLWLPFPRQDHYGFQQRPGGYRLGRRLPENRSHQLCICRDQYRLSFCPARHRQRLSPDGGERGALICNVFFNYVFIFGNLGAPALGVKGAALATVIARAVETGATITLVYTGKRALAASRVNSPVSVGST